MIRGVLAGSLGLIALQTVVASNQSAGRVGQLATWTASAINRAVSPAVPLIPDRRKASSSQPSSYAGGSTTSGGTGTAQLPAQQFDPRKAPVPTVPTNPNPAPVIAGSSYT